jgi:hypothetical protein
MVRSKKQPKQSRRERYGIWQFYLTKSLQVFRPILLRVAKGLGLTVAEFIRDAVLEKLARHDEEAAARYRDWLEL